MQNSQKNFLKILQHSFPKVFLKFPHIKQLAILHHCDLLDIFISWDFPAGCTFGSDIALSPNCVEIDSCVGCFLLTLKVERRICRTESKSLGDIEIQ